MDRKNFDITKKLKDMADQMEAMKSTQQLAGDGWVVYRRSDTFNFIENANYRVEYIPDDDSEIVTTVVYYQGRTLIGSIDENNVWYLTHFFPTGDYGIQVYSVKIGTIVVTQV